MMRLMQVLAKLERDAAGRIHTTWPQLAAGMGFPLTGLNTQGIIDRYSSRVRNSMGYLIDAGLVEGWDTAYEGREPTGILVRVDARVAQSVRATGVLRRSRGACERPSQGPSFCSQPASRAERSASDLAVRRRPFFSGEVGKPMGGLRGKGDSVGSSCPERTAAGARGAPSARELAELAASVGAALRTVETAGTEQGALSALMAFPWLAEVPPAIVLREAVRLAPGPRLRTLALSVRWEQRLERAVQRIVRAQGTPSAGVHSLLRLAWGERRRDNREPYSLGGYAALLRKRARLARARARELA